MRRPARRFTLVSVFAFGLGLLAGTPHVWAQGPIGSLGGYGAMAGASSSSMGSGSMVPFAGRFGAMTPARMSGGGSLAFSPRPSAMMSGNRPSFTIGPMGMGSGVSGMSGGMGPSFGRRPFTLSPLSPSGGIGPEGMPSMAGPRGLGVMPPSFGYPFRQPPSLVSPSSAGAGMSM